MLLAAATGRGPASDRALFVLGDPSREFASDPYVVLEVLPKAVYFGRRIEERFYRDYFDAVRHWVAELNLLLPRASEVAQRFGLSAMDSLHVAAAALLGCDEIITTERRSKPMARNTLIRVVSFLE